jgi:HEAT repeat protein
MTRRLLGITLAAFVALCFARAALAQSDDTLALFKKYWNTYKDSPSRVEAILTLEGKEELGVVELLVPKLKDNDTEVVRAAVRVLAGFKTRPPVDALLAALKNDKTEATRTGILRALTDGKYKDVQAGVTPCLTDKAWEVRRHAIQALAATGDAELAKVIAPLCNDAEPAVRGEALDALVKFKSPLAVEPALKMLNDNVWQARVSAIAALTKIRSKDSVEPLILRIEKEEGVLVPDIAEALANLTGKEFGGKPDKWKEWWAANKDSFVLPDESAIAYLRANKEAKTGESHVREYAKSGVVKYHGIDTPSRSIMFVIDCSGSMESLVVEKERFQDGNYPSLSRIDIVKTELQRTIDHLEPFVNFNIIAFATDVDPWKKKLVPANILNKSEAKTWVGHLIAIGGASKEDLVSVGLTGSGNLEKGKTNTYGALMTALNVTGGPKTGDKNYTVDVDTVFFLSDGRPTVGEFVDPDDILREIRTVNELRKVKIHTIAIGEFQKDFMRKIAEQNGGTFVDLGK